MTYQPGFTYREIAMMRRDKELRARHKRERKADALIIATLQQNVDDLASRLSKSEV